MNYTIMLTCKTGIILKTCIFKNTWNYIIYTTPEC